MAAATPCFASRRLLMACAICVALGAWALSGVAEEGRGAVNGPVAQLGSQQVDKAALADFWFQRYPEEYARTLDALLDQLVHRGRGDLRTPHLDARLGALNQLFRALRSQQDEAKFAVVIFDDSVHEMLPQRPSALIGLGAVVADVLI